MLSADEPVAPDTNHVEVEVTYKRLRDCDDIDGYVLDDRCAFNTIDSWEEST